MQVEDSSHTQKFLEFMSIYLDASEEAGIFFILSLIFPLFTCSSGETEALRTFVPLPTPWY